MIIAQGKFRPTFRIEFSERLGSPDGPTVRLTSLHPDFPKLGDVPSIVDQLRDLIERIEEGRRGMAGA